MYNILEGVHKYHKPAEKNKEKGIKWKPYPAKDGYFDWKVKRMRRNIIPKYS